MHVRTISFKNILTHNQAVIDWNTQGNIAIVLHGIDFSNITAVEQSDKGSLVNFRAGNFLFLCVIVCEFVR